MKFKLNFGKNKKEDMKKNMAPEKPEEKPEAEEMEMNMDSVLVDEEGNEYPVSELVENYKMSQNSEPETEETVVNMEDTVTIDGKEVSMKELYDNYCARKNAEPPTDQPLEDVVDEDLKKNSLGDEDGDKETPNKNFRKLKINASQGAEIEKIKVNTQKTRLDRGRARYGSAVHNGGDK